MLDEEEQQLEQERKLAEQKERELESAATVCLGQVELKKNDDGTIHAYVKSSSLTEKL